MSITVSTLLTSGAADAHREGITGDQLKVDVADILSYNAELANYVLDNPSESLPLVHSPLLDILRKATSFGLVTMGLDLNLMLHSRPRVAAWEGHKPVCVCARSWRRWPMRYARSRCTIRRPTMRRRSCRSCRCCCTAAGALGPSPSGSSRYSHQMHLL